MISLFALANGDSMNDIIVDVSLVGYFGQIFLFVYVLLFFTAVQNVMIFIVIEGYEFIYRKI